MKPKNALAEASVPDINPKQPLAQDSAPDTDPDFVEIRFGELPGRCRIINAIRRKLGNYFFETGIEMSLLTRSSDKDAYGIPYIVVAMDRKIEYVSVNDVAIDSSSLSDKERKLSPLEQRTKLWEMLNISYK